MAMETIQNLRLSYFRLGN